VYGNGVSNAVEDAGDAAMSVRAMIESPQDREEIQQMYAIGARMRHEGSIVQPPASGAAVKDAVDAS
ncbi:MAG TPA: hypothetical protein VJT75_05780, partial [Thermoleophilaceae bacterium]|nr:hypothetical protein [Thermoleophilaceae bacterium]